jgi:hypothetical protein
MAKMLIANRLIDGVVVFHAEDGSWVESIAAGQLIDDEDAAGRLLEAGLADERDNKVIDPCLIDVSKAGGHLIPDATREAIRATGPTIVAETGQLPKPD